MIIRITFLISMFFLLSCKAKRLETDNEKYSYAVGVQLGQSLKMQSIQIDQDILNMAISDVLSDKELRLPENEMIAAARNVMAKKEEDRKAQFDTNKLASEKFLEENKNKEGVEVTKSGLQYKILVEGDGAKPKSSSKVELHYKGMLIGGTEFDSSYKRNSPATFDVSGTIPGMSEALKLASEGTKMVLYIPPELAYGERELPGIPPGSTLIFELELLKVL